MEPLNDFDTLNKQIRDKYLPNKEYWNKLDDRELFNLYVEQPAVKKNKQDFQDNLLKYEIPTDVVDKLFSDKAFMLKYIIPPSVKSTIRGNKFNNLVKDAILSLNLSEDFEICFEKNCKEFNTSEIPDFYVKNNEKIMIGFNQIDLWEGGHQTNRGSKYIINNQSTDDVKIVCVITKYPELLKTKRKKYKIFKEGFDKNILFYITGLLDYIKDYFQIRSD